MKTRFGIEFVSFDFNILIKSQLGIEISINRIVALSKYLKTVLGMYLCIYLITIHSFLILLPVIANSLERL